MRRVRRLSTTHIPAAHLSAFYIVRGPRKTHLSRYVRRVIQNEGSFFFFFFNTHCAFYTRTATATTSVRPYTLFERGVRIASLYRHQHPHPSHDYRRALRNRTVTTKGDGVCVSRIIISGVAEEEVNVPAARADHRAPSSFLANRASIIISGGRRCRRRRGGSEKTFTTV